MLIHGTCVDIQKKGILLLGKPGSGKSDTALRLIDQGALLVSDDQVDLEVSNGTLIASAPSTIKGLLEIRGVGIVKMPICDQTPIHLVVELVEKEKVERMPIIQFYTYEKIRLPLLKLNAFEASTPAKIKVVLNQPELFFLEKE